VPEVAGDAACMVDSFNVTSIHEGIPKIINDPVYRDELVRRGFDNIERFRPEKIAQEYVDIYRELLTQ
jgi:glycosyltransferase involved in cell wall biosynthesis